MAQFTSAQLTTAKNISIVQILSKNGYEPTKQDNTRFWYTSPLRSEKTASFAVYKDNSFYDFGLGFGGDVIALTSKLLNLNFVETVKMLLNTQNFSFVSPKIEKTTKDTQIKIESIKPLKNPFFLNYIKKRSVSIEIAEKYLSEIYYKTSDTQTKPYFGIGMQNASNGYEVKNIKSNQYFCLGTKDITIIDNGYFDTFVVFEGMFDFLAFLTYYDKPIKSNVIILHSVSNVSKFLECVGDTTKKICLFLDNDQAGNQATEKIFLRFAETPKISVLDFRNIYQNNKDFCDFLGQNVPKNDQKTGTFITKKPP